MTDGTTNETTPIEEQGTTTDSTSEVNWENKYKELQSDYTRKSQELSSLKKAPQVEHTPEEAQLKDWIAREWFVSKDELQRREQEILDKVQFEQLLNNYPDLWVHEKAIRDLQANGGGSLEEVAIRYWFTTADKLEKARGRSVMVGDNTKEQPKQKGILEMTDSEYTKRKKQNIGNSSSFESVQTF